MLTSNMKASKKMFGPDGLLGAVTETGGMGRTAFCPGAASGGTVRDVWACCWEGFFLSAGSVLGRLMVEPMLKWPASQTMKRILSQRLKRKGKRIAFVFCQEKERMSRTLGELKGWMRIRSGYAKTTRVLAQPSAILSPFTSKEINSTI